MKKIGKFRMVITILGILGILVTFCISTIFKEAFYVSENNWNGDELSETHILIEENQVIEQEFIATRELLSYFYIIIDDFCAKDPMEEGTLNIQLKDEKSAVLFEYNLPLQIIDTADYYVPNICNLKLKKGDVYRVVLSSMDLGNEQIKVRAKARGEILLGTSYQYMDTSDLNVVRVMILTCYAVLMAGSVIWRLLQKNWKNIYKFLFSKRKYGMTILLISILVVVLFIYDGIISSVILSIVIVSSYYCGQLLEKYVFKTRNSRWVTIALGMGGIGCLVYFVFEFGIGCRQTVGLILATPILLCRKKIENFEWKITREKIVDKINENKGYATWLCVCLAIAVIFAFSPIDGADEGWKHLPITVYASNNGQWYHNMMEDVIAYSESTLLPYCYSVIFALFGEIKGYILFNVFLVGAIYFSLLQVLREIYPKVSKGIFAAVYMTTPLFVMLGTAYMVDCIPYFFLSAVLLNLVSLDWRTILYRFPQVAFLYGLCIFSKLTILPSLCILAVVMGGLLIKWLVEESASGVEKIRTVVITFGKSVICFVFPFLYAFVSNYYRTGNPFSITAYNEIFKSPYISQAPFSRPFADVKFTLGNIGDIVFHTNNYIEMQPGGVGFFLLLGILVPVSWFFYRKVRYVIFSIVPVAIYLLQGLIVGNLRYLWGILALELGLVVIAVDILLDHVKARQIRKGGMALLCLSLTIPNAFYIYKNFQWKKKLIPNHETTTYANCKILEEVPEKSRILSLNDKKKGDYDGFYFSLTWENSYILNKIIDGTYDFPEFVKGFDYVLYNKASIAELHSEIVLRMFWDICADAEVMEKVEESASHILYRVKNKEEKSCLWEEKYEEGELLKKGDSLSFYIPGQYQNLEIQIEYEMKQNVYKYQNVLYSLEEKMTKEDLEKISENSKNLQESTCELWAGISWIDEKGKFLQYDNVGNQCFSSWNSAILGPVERPDNAQAANLSIRNVDDTEILIKHIIVLGEEGSSIIDDEIEKYFMRQPLLEEE